MLKLLFEDVQKDGDQVPFLYSELNNNKNSRNTKQKIKKIKLHQGRIGSLKAEVL